MWKYLKLTCLHLRVQISCGLCQRKEPTHPERGKKGGKISHSQLCDSPVVFEFSVQEMD